MLVTSDQSNSLLKDLPAKYDVIRPYAHKLLSAPGVQGKGKLIAAGIGIATTLVGNIIANYLEEDEGFTGNGLPTPITQTKTSTLRKARGRPAKRRYCWNGREYVPCDSLRRSSSGKYKRSRNRKYRR